MNSVQPDHLSRPVPHPAAIALTFAAALAACATGPNAGNTAGKGVASSYSASCLTGAAVGAAMMAILNRNKNKPLKERQSELAKAAAGGCAVGLAATAIGRLMDSRQQQQHEAEMQKEARRRALEQQQYAAAAQRIQAKPTATPQQRAARDTELERARAAYQESLSTPVQVNLGNGGTSTIQVQPPPEGANTPSAPAAPAQVGCTDYSVLVRTPAGQARQYETWCPNSSGQMVRAEVREAPAS